MIIGIGGPSRSGKSTLARLLVNHYRDSGLTSIVIYQDDFVFPTPLIPKIKDKVDWECPDSINHNLLLEIVAFYKTRFHVLIIDGFLAFHDPRLVKQYNKKLFVEVTKETYLLRKENDLRWGDIPRWFFEHIWNSYIEYGIPDFSKQDYIRISGETEYDIKKIIPLLEKEI